ncbi:MAG: serine protease [Dehalococcoidia bacterium]
MEDAAQSLVHLSSGDRTWNGVIIDEAGVILTASHNLGMAPLVEFQTHNGETGQAWVVGRDDDYGFALLQITSGNGGYEAIPVADLDAPVADEDLYLLQFNATGSTIEKRVARVLTARPDLQTGLRYVQVQVPVGPAGTGEGALLIDQQGQLRAVRAGADLMSRIAIGLPSEVYGVSASGLANQIIPQLTTGIVSIREDVDEGNSDSFPELPHIFRGSANLSGAPLDAGSRIYARLTKAGQPDLWFTQQLTNDGSYVLAAAVMTSGYANANVEFWMDAKRASETEGYSPGGNSVVNLEFE